MSDILETRELTSAEGFDLKIRQLVDSETRPDDFECYSEKDLDAWRGSHWDFVGYQVVASKAGIELGDAAIFGVEDGIELDNGSTYNMDAFIAENYYLEDLVRDAVHEAKIKLAELSA